MEKPEWMFSPWFYPLWGPLDLRLNVLLYGHRFEKDKTLISRWWTKTPWGKKTWQAKVDAYQRKVSKYQNFSRGESVKLLGLPEFFCHNLPEEDRIVCQKIIGTNVVVEDDCCVYPKRLVEITFVDNEKNTHFIWLEPEYLQKL